MALGIQAAPQTVLVIGATGMLGSAVAKAFGQVGHHVRLLARNVEAARAQFPAFEVAAGDVRDAGSVDQAMEGCDSVFVSLKAPSLAEAQAVEVAGTGGVAEAAARQGARIMYLSGAGLGEHHRSIPFAAVKLDAEARIRASGAEFTIFRPTHFMESLWAFVRGGRADVIGRQPHRYHYLAADDFGHMVAGSATLDKAAGRSFEIFGPQAFTMTEALGVYRDIVRPDLKVGMVPLPILRTVAFVSRNRQLAHVADLFAAFVQIGEAGDPAPANRLLGAPATTLDSWCRTQALAQKVPT